MGARRDVPAGTRFGKRVVLAKDARRGRGQYFVCRCDCGREDTVRGAKLFAGEANQCLSCSASNHGATRRGKVMPEYGIWAAMCRRCEEGNAAAANYYDRGIRVFPDWCGDGGFVNFLAHVGRRPSKHHSIDRVDNDGNYEPGNVRWATRIEQARNTQKSRYVTLDGLTKTVPEWAEMSGVPAYVIHGRLNRGWGPGRAVYAPVHKPAHLALGTQIGDWTVIGAGSRIGHQLYLECRCKCGFEKLVKESHLKTGSSLRCIKCASKLARGGLVFGKKEG